MILMFIVRVKVTMGFQTDEIKGLTMKKEQPKLVTPAMSKEELRQLLELRRSSASSKHRNKRKYNRKKVDKRNW